VRIVEVHHERVFEVKNVRSICRKPCLGTVGPVSADIAADVPDEALRPALELAVGIAAASAKVRPQLAFPVGLKPFLRFHKLPATALQQVRAAVEGDDDFRKRLASVATPDLVDEVGVMWLCRPEGWTQHIAELLPDKVADDEVAFRREERRRMAAQEAVARSRVEVLALNAELERERAAKGVVTSENDRLRRELDDVRARLREAQRAEHASAQSLAKLETEIVELRRIKSEPTTPPPPVVDSAAVRGLLDNAVAASTDIARILAEALQQIAPSDDARLAEASQPALQRRIRRRPVRLPGGVLAGTAEAAEFLLRGKGAEILIDGYNVAKLGWPALELDEQREHSIKGTENMAKRWNIGMTIVFDGASVEGAHSSTRRKVRITYSPKGVSADDVLRAEVAGVDSTKPVVIVTNDRAIITDVVAQGANTISSDDFLALLRR
jgi:predicted RNA-binding protein with PIN domain